MIFQLWSYFNVIDRNGNQNDQNGLQNIAHLVHELDALCHYEYLDHVFRSKCSASYNCGPRSWNWELRAWESRAKESRAWESRPLKSRLWELRGYCYRIKVKEMLGWFGGWLVEKPPYQLFYSPLLTSAPSSIKNGPKFANKHFGWFQVSKITLDTLLPIFILDW